MGSRFLDQGDGSWLMDRGGPNPDREVLTQTLRLSSPVSLLRLTALTRPGEEGRGPGNASNGNLVISEVEIRVGGILQPLTALANTTQRRSSSLYLCDTLVDGNNGWFAGTQRGNRELYLFTVGSPLPADTDIEIKIHSVHRSKRHTLGYYRLDGYPVSPWFPPKTVIAQSVNGLPAFYTPRSSAYPALNCFDARGRLIGAAHALPHDISAPALAEKIRAILERRSRWEDLMRMASSAPSLIGKTKMMSDAWKLMKQAGFPGAKEVERDILTVDPRRRSPWTWRVTPDIKRIDEGEKQAAKKGVQERLAYLDRVLADPLLAEIGIEIRQRLILRKFEIYRNWPGHEKERFGPLREIARVGPETHIGLGARGYIEMNGQCGYATIGYGWYPEHIRTGRQTLEISRGVPINFYKPGLYEITLWTFRSKRPLQVGGVSLVSDGLKISEDLHPSTLVRKGDTNNVYRVELVGKYKPETLSLRIDLTAPEGHGHSGRISITPCLPARGKFGWRGSAL